MHIGYYRHLKKQIDVGHKKNNIGVKICRGIHWLFTHRDRGEESRLFSSKCWYAELVCCGAHLSLWFDHTRTHMIHWQVDPRSRISIPLQVPAKNEARNEWGTCSLQKNALRIATYLSTATPRAKRARVATLRSSCSELIVCYFSVSSCSNSPFLSSMNGNTHKPQLSVRVSYFTKRPQSTNLPSVSGVTRRVDFPKWPFARRPNTICWRLECQRMYK